MYESIKLKVAIFILYIFLNYHQNNQLQNKLDASYLSLINCLIINIKILFKIVKKLVFNVSKNLGA